MKLSVSSCLPKRQLERLLIRRLAITNLAVYRIEADAFRLDLPIRKSWQV